MRPTVLSFYCCFPSWVDRKLAPGAISPILWEGGGTRNWHNQCKPKDTTVEISENVDEEASGSFRVGVEGVPLPRVPGQCGSTQGTEAAGLFLDSLPCVYLTAEVIFYAAPL